MLVDSIVVTRQRYVPERSISEQIKCAASTMKQSLFTTAKETGHGFLAELNWGDPTEWISGNASKCGSRDSRSGLLLSNYSRIHDLGWVCPNNQLAVRISCGCRVELRSEVRFGRRQAAGVSVHRCGAVAARVGMANQNDQAGEYNNTSCALLPRHQTKWPPFGTVMKR